MSSSGQERLAAGFARLADRGQGGLGAYVIGGDPHLEATPAILRALAAAGADLIELGFPFSDPVGDGPAIQAGHLRSLAHGTTLRQIISCVREVRSEIPDIPIILMGYVNPVLALGIEETARSAAGAGVDGFIIVDQPLEEANAFRAACDAVGLANILMAAPTTSAERLERIGRATRGFLYMASMAGTTGSGAIDCDATLERVRRARAVTATPIAVGFGVRTAEDVEAITQGADLAVVGTAVVEAVARASGTPADAAAACVRSLLAMRR